jgi:hypothetical protein
MKKYVATPTPAPNTSKTVFTQYSSLNKVQKGVNYDDRLVLEEVER